MSIVLNPKIQLRLHRWVIYLICRYIAYRLSIKKYIIAGSFRRKKWMSNDIDLLVPAEDLSTIEPGLIKMGWKLNPLRRHDRTFSRQYLKPVKLLNARKFIVLDLMPYTDNNMGNVLAFATGSASSNSSIRKYLLNTGRSWNWPAYIHIIDSDAKLEFKDENSFFEYLGVPLMLPEMRDKPYVLSDPNHICK